MRTRIKTRIGLFAILVFLASFFPRRAGCELRRECRGSCHQTTREIQHKWHVSVIGEAGDARYKKCLAGSTPAS